MFFLVGVSSWFFMFFMGGGADVKTNERWGEDTGPYPNALADNIFWFVQVRKSCMQLCRLLKVI